MPQANGNIGGCNVARFEEHCEDSGRALGRSFDEVHVWLDELQAVYGPMHRPFRHHTGGVEQVRAMWGDEAAKAAEIHVRRDCGGVLPTPEALREYWGIRLEDIEPEDD